MKQVKAGDVVQYYTDKTGHKTGKFVRVIERSARDFGLYLIENWDETRVKVRPGDVRGLNERSDADIRPGARVRRGYRPKKKGGNG